MQLTSAEKNDAPPPNLQWRDGRAEPVEVQRYASHDYDPQSTPVSLKNRTAREIDIKLVRPESAYLEDVSIIYTLNEELEEDGNLLVKEYLEKIEQVNVGSCTKIRLLCCLLSLCEENEHTD